MGRTAQDSRGERSKETEPDGEARFAAVDQRIRKIGRDYTGVRQFLETAGSVWAER